MKVTDVFTLFHKSNPSPPTLKGEGVKPVSLIDKMSLQPGQLFRGEVLGEDANGHLLLKIGGEIIATRGLVSMMTGQQVWVEVKDVGDSPLFALATAKGAVHELLKNIMEVRPAVLTQEKGDASVASEFQTSLASSKEMSFVPSLVPLQESGILPRETTQLLKAILALPKAEIPPLSAVETKQIEPFLSFETGKIDIGTVVTVLSDTGRLPPVLSELAPLRPLFMFKGESGQSSIGVDLAKPNVVETVPVTASADKAVPGSTPAVPFITTDGQVVSYAVQVVRSLVETVALLPAEGADTQPPPPLSKGFADLVQSILVEGKIPETVRNLEPMQQLLQVGGPVLGKAGASIPSVTLDEFIQGFAQAPIEGKVLSHVEHNETVAKLLSGLQGAQPKPELLRVLKQLVSSSQMRPEDDETSPDEKHSGKMNEAVLGVAKAASFFKSQTVVNHEVAHATQGDCVLVPCFFAGQSGWGEWMWSRESKGKQEESKENLVFFLEMSQLGPVAIQAILGENSLSGQFQVTDDHAQQLINQGLPVLEEHLGALGYKAHFSCRIKPVAVMQEIKELLENRTSDTNPTSLVDIQA